MLAGLRKWANVAVVASLAVLRTAVVSSPIVVQAPLEVTIHRSWDSPPASDSSDNLLFFRLASLLQHWPNSRYPHSLSVVRGTIPIGTTLYHGRPITAVPSEPEWLGFDPEISVFFLKGSSTSRITTFTTTRTLRVLYFDGTSAAKLTTGTFDTQELLVNFGEHSKNKTFDEYRRIAMLCEWGKDKDIDGYVRMEMDFELMLCDFASNLELVSSVHILPTDNASPHPPDEPRPSHWKGALLPGEARDFEVFQAAAWHGRSPGETRVRLDAARLVSIYDPALLSGAIARRGVEKVLHRGFDLNAEDVRTWQGWIARIARPDAPETSGVDWQALAKVIVDRYGGRLEYMRSLLQPGRVFTNTTAVEAVRAQLMLVLLTDLTSADIPDNSQHSYKWAEPIVTHCSTFLLSHLPFAKFTREEYALFNAISGTQSEICRVLALTWSEAYDVPPNTDKKALLQRWLERIDSLMAWLDWSLWNRCIPDCDLDHMCWIPTWPVGLGTSSMPGAGGPEDPRKVDWTPRCIPRGKLEGHFDRDML